MDILIYSVKLAFQMIILIHISISSIRISILMHLSEH